MTYRDQLVQCLHCEAALEETASRWACGQCGSTLVPADALRAMLLEIEARDPRTLDERMRPATSPSRRCPRCAAMMAPYLLHDTLVDRCPEHGVWFDPGELAAAFTACTAHANARAEAGFVPMGWGFVSAFLGGDLLAASTMVALPLFAVAALGFGAGALQRWLVRRKPRAPGE